MFIAPCVVALVAAFAYPTIRTLAMSLHANTMGGTPDFVGFANYVRIFADPAFPSLLATSLLYTAGNVVVVWVVGLTTAMLLNNRFPGRAVIRSLFILPWATPYVAASLIFAWMLGFDSGVFNYLLSLVSRGAWQVDFLTACPDALITLTGISTWKLFPLGTVMMLSALQTVPDSHYEAAKVDGATALQRFYYITLPGVRSTSITLTLLMMIWCFGRSFTAIYLLTDGGPAGCSETIVLRSYSEMFGLFHPGTAAALGVCVLLLSLACAIAYLAVLRMGSAQDAS